MKNADCKMRRPFAAVPLFVFAALVCGAQNAGCSSGGAGAGENRGAEESFGGAGGTRITVTASGQAFSAVLADTAAAEAFARMIADAGGTLSLQLQDYGGFEKVGSLGRTLPASDRRMTAVEGDVMLYNASSIVLFYGSNTWSYTRLARVEDTAGWAQALRRSDGGIRFSLERGVSPAVSQK